MTDVHAFVGQTLRRDTTARLAPGAAVPSSELRGPVPGGSTRDTVVIIDGNPCYPLGMTRS